MTPYLGTSSIVGDGRMVVYDANRAKFLSTSDTL